MDKPDFDILNPNPTKEGDYKDELLESLVGEEVKIVDYYEQDLAMVRETYVIIIEHNGQKYELTGGGGYDGESRFELNPIEEANNE